MEDWGNHTAQEVLDDRLNLSEHWRVEEAPGCILSEDIANVSNRGAFRGREGVRESARMPDEELHEPRSFEYTHISIEERMTSLERSYEDDSMRVRDGPYLSRTARLSPRPSTTR